MKYIVSWKGETGKMKREYLETIEANSIYQAKARYLKARGVNSKLGQYRMRDLLTLVLAKCTEDGRVKRSLPGDIDLEAFIEGIEQEAEEVVAR